MPAFSQDPRAYTNKLAPYVASPARVVDLMLEMAKIKPGETVYDLGSGDGRIVIAAAGKYKAKAVGVEISPKLVASATADIERAKLSDQARVVQGDVLKTDFTGADVVTMYLETQLNAETEAAPREVPETRRPRGFSRLSGSRLEGHRGSRRSKAAASIPSICTRFRRPAAQEVIPIAASPLSIWPG